MAQGLRIGEVAQLVRVSTKTIRHYHKVGLLAEPTRTEAGYRLYGASDLLRLQSVRRLQALGLSLAQIRELLEGVEQAGSLREVLEALLTESERQRQQLEERCERIRALLAREPLRAAEQPAVDGALVQLLQNEFGALAEGVDPALLEQERQLWAVVDEYHWPAPSKQAMQEAMQRMADHARAHPAEYQALLAWGELFTTLSTMAADDPEIERLAQRFVDSDALTFLEAVQSLGEPPSMGAPMEEVMRELFAFQLTPTQQRFMELVQYYATQE
ncbi:MAG: MerR family transcriptional regulator [Ardenticatenales bacterium]|nr:MerR family transcriptional regulator [Ardenticatenales bacterium]